MSIAKPTVKPVWANAAAGGDIAEPTGLEGSGWISSSAAPPYQWINWLFNICSQMGRYAMARGVPDHDTNDTYSISDVTQDGSTGIVYQCIQACAGSVALSNASYWKKFGVGWLANAILSDMASLLPSQIVSAMSTQFGVGGSGNAGSGSVKFFGFQICWRQVTFTPDGSGFPAQQDGMAWSAPFTAFYGAIATGISPAPCTYTLPMSSNPTHNFSIRPYLLQNAPGTYTAFVVGIGTPG